MDGQGTFAWANGDVYIGTWVAGHMHGTGTRKHANGDAYEGVGTPFLAWLAV